MEKEKIISKLHFPHFVHSDGNEPVVYEDGEIFWKSIELQFNRMINEENWHHSTLAKCEIISLANSLYSALLNLIEETKIKKATARLKVFIATLTIIINDPCFWNNKGIL